MSTFTAGTRVRVNTSYGEGYDDTDDTTAATHGELGTVVKHNAMYIEVMLDNEELRMEWGNHLFVPEELDLLEAHPL